MEHVSLDFDDEQAYRERIVKIYEQHNPSKVCLVPSKCGSANVFLFVGWLSNNQAIPSEMAIIIPHEQNSKRGNCPILGKHH